MEAQKARCFAVAVVWLIFSLSASGASYQTVNFSVSADSGQVAEQVGKAAEVYRKQLAVFWLGKPLPNWSRPCRLTVRHGTLGPCGQTTFQFVRGEVLNWRMHVQGSLERILDSVLPHEINHTIFACHFRRPLPRWADEGAATLFEHRSEQVKQLALLNDVVRNRSEMISLSDLLSMKDYPQGQRSMLTLYAQGYTLADFLVQQKGRQAFLRFISDGERDGWEKAIRRNFDHEGIQSLERNWRGWVLAGMPSLITAREQMLAAEEADKLPEGQETSRPELPPFESVSAIRGKGRKSMPTGIVRSQSPESTVHRNDSASSGRYAELSYDFKTDGRDPSAVPELLSGTDSAAAARRSFSIEAPVPRRMPTSQPMPEQQPFVFGSEASAPNAELPEFGSSLLNDPNTFGGLQPSDSRVLEAEMRSSELEPTALSSPESDPDGRTATENESGVFRFGMDLPPAERKVNSGRIPQWAGFPGQKKLF